ncbi:hypothetical protein SO802_003398 [Lithocarpus litseifolius]|uniref:RNase H type-1 domain-containing protein n=1 Tax=Lithocarpus litseifolius TaxID=425828 RepID=A0AAW2E3S8_9ROSI
MPGSLPMALPTVLQDQPISLGKFSSFSPFGTYGSKEMRSQVLKDIPWERPPRGWVKLNTDGSSLGNPGTAGGGGGIIHDDSGHWLTGFSQRIGITSSFMAELWALRDGLKCCVDRSFEAVVVELDARAVIDTFSNLNSPNLAGCSLVDDCRWLLTQIPQVTIRHCYREANRYLTKNHHQITNPINKDAAMPTTPMVTIMVRLLLLRPPHFKPKGFPQSLSLRSKFEPLKLAKSAGTKLKRLLFTTEKIFNQFNRLRPYGIELERHLLLKIKLFKNLQSAISAQDRSSENVAGEI